MQQTKGQVQTHKRFQWLVDNWRALEEAMITFAIAMMLVLISMFRFSKSFKITMLMFSMFFIGWATKCLHIMVRDYRLSQKNANREGVELARITRSES